MNIRKRETFKIKIMKKISTLLAIAGLFVLQIALHQVV
jgi:hypothetical protein